MTELEKFEQRLAALNEAIEAVRHAASVDRKMSHDKHLSGHFTKALTELESLKTSVNAHKIRFETIGR